jgi:hypothetical protein
MATRTIVTSQPDVACEVCERRLLRGEQQNIFLAAGRRRIVCELCAPRAAHEGWMRETDSQSLSLPPMRPRRGRSLFERLPAPFRMRQSDRSSEDSLTAAPQESARAQDDLGEELAAPDPLAGVRAAEPAGHAQTDTGRHVGGQEPYDLFADADVGDWQERAGVPEPAAGAAKEPEMGVVREPPSAYVEQALAVFNESEFPRRVAGVARSLGAPAVNVRSSEHLASVVSIVVAWELCWYRYEVDLSEPVVEAQVIAQGTELGELGREDRIANAAAVDSGALVLADV